MRPVLEEKMRAEFTLSKVEGSLSERVRGKRRPTASSARVSPYLINPVVTAAAISNNIQPTIS